MSCVEVRLAVRASPLLARSLFTVRAAISSALPSDVPRSSSPSLMCSYWRSRLDDQAACGTASRRSVSIHAAATWAAGGARGAQRGRPLRDLVVRAHLDV